MIALILLIVIARPLPPLIDRVEINTVHIEGESPAFTQAVLWRWDRYYHRFVVSQWLIIDDSQTHRIRETVLLRSKPGERLVVRAKTFRRTYGIDTEYRDRQVLPEGDRLPYLPRRQ